MRFIRSRRGAVVLAFVVVGLVATLSAQGNGNPTILQAVQAVQSTANSLVKRVSPLTTTVDNINTATTPGNTRFTPALHVQVPDDIGCRATNVSSAPRNVTIQLFKNTPFENSAELDFQITIDLNPGTTLGITRGTLGGFYYCKLTVNNGVKTDVRGVLTLSDFSSDKSPVAVE
jgi:hypothetical protein